MNIRVIRKSGEVETITFTEPLEIVRGNPFNIIKCATGMEHWFTQDGVYDGWGMDVASANMNAEEGLAFAEAIERDRVFPNEDTPR